MSNVHFEILIDGGIYEGNENFEDALYLYDTVEYSCLREYYGHTKTFQVTEGDKTIKLKEGKIEKPLMGVRLHFKNGRTIDTFRRLFPEEATALLGAEYKGEIPHKVELINRDGEVICEIE